MTAELEARFRVWAFHIYYTRSFRNVVDPFRRFGKALEASSRPILRPELVEEWDRKYGGKPLTKLLEDAGSSSPLQTTLFRTPGRWTA